MKKIIIVGAGVAGMTAAMHAIKEGYSVDIYTTSKYVGGKCSTLFDVISQNVVRKKTNNKQLPPELFRIDNGQHLISMAYKKFFELLDWLGTQHLLADKRGLKVNFIDVDLDRKYSLVIKPDNKLAPLFGLFQMKYISTIDKIRLFRAIPYILKNKEKLIDYTILDLCKKIKISDYTIKHLITPIVVSIMNEPIDIVPASLLISTISTLASAGTDGLTLTYCKETLDKLFAPFIDKIHAAENCNLYLQTKVEDFIIEDGICKGVILSNKTQNTANAVISTLPIGCYRTTSINEYKNIEQHFFCSTILSVYFWTNERLNLAQEYNAIVGSKIDWIFDMNTKKNVENNLYQYRITKSNFIRATENKDIRKLIEEELTKIFKKEILIYGMRIIPQKLATPLITTTNNKLRPHTQSHIKNLYIAGDWTNTGLPACIESAALSGYNAIKAINNI